MNQQEIENRIAKLQWEYYNTDQRNEHACNVCLQLMALKVMLQLQSEK